VLFVEGLHGHLHCLFAHLILFNGRFRLIDDKETEILNDLVIALRLQPSDGQCRFRSYNENRETQFNHVTPSNTQSIPVNLSKTQ